MIVVVGAGLIGLSIAYELAARGADVRVVDGGEAGRGASWAGAGMLAPFTDPGVSPAFEAFGAQSLARYPGFVADIQRRGGVDARLRLGGILEAAYDEPGERRLRASVSALCGRGCLARYVSGLEARSLEPALGIDVRGASFSPSEGSIDNRRLGRALRATCLVLGVRIDECVGDVALEADTRRVLGVRTEQGFVPAQSVVNAAGAWAGALAGVPARARVAIVPIKGQMLALAMPRRFVRHVLWVPGAYLVPRDDGRLLIGATVEDVGFDARVTAGGIGRLLAAALAALPTLADLALAETWTGLRPGTPDDLPYIGPTVLGGYVVATGHYRNGILLAPATAAAVADILEGRPRDDLAAFSPEREEARVPAAKETA